MQPTEPNASTNLFIWTPAERLNYELEPAGDVSAMDFAIDQIPAEIVPPKTVAIAPPRPSQTEVLLLGKPVRLESAKPSHGRIEVTICDWYDENGRVLVRYDVRNRSNHFYDVSSPRLYQLIGVHYPQSLYTLVGSQLGEQKAAHLMAKDQSAIPVLESHLPKEHLAPGEDSVGIIAFHLNSTAQPTVLRFQFPNDQREQVDAFLVR